jgi:hypothetical protein
MGAQGATGPAFGAVGFSAQLTNTAVGAATNSALAGWSTSSPFFTDGAFDGAAYTVPSSGHYHCRVVANYRLTTAVLASDSGSSTAPVVSLRKSGVAILTSALPVLRANIDLGTNNNMVLSSGQAVLDATVDLVAGDVLDVFYSADALNVGVTFGMTTDPQSGPATWSCHRIS